MDEIPILHIPIFSWARAHHVKYDTAHLGTDLTEAFHGFVQFAQRGNAFSSHQYATSHMFAQHSRAVTASTGWVSSSTTSYSAETFSMYCFRLPCCSSRCGAQGNTPVGMNPDWVEYCGALPDQRCAHPEAVPLCRCLERDPYNGRYSSYASLNAFLFGTYQSLTGSACPAGIYVLL